MRSLSLAVVADLNAVERFAWVAEAIPTFEGSGIVYGLTVDGVHALAAFLREEGLDVEAYTGRTPPEVREEIEGKLRRNELKAVVATSALGMGYDKPDLAFCIHVGSPNSPVAYYQQVGRAGRALDSAAGVLLPADESDARIWEYFITATLPDPDMAHRALALLAERPMSTVQLEAELNSPRSRVEVLLKQLHVDGAVRRVRSTWETTGSTWEFDGEKYDRVVRLRRREAEIMAAYARGDRCLMQLLIEALDDPEAQPCGTCSVCTGTLPAPGARPDPQTVRRALAAMRQRPNIIEPRKLWPTGGPWKGRITGLEPGRAVARGADSGWNEIIDEVTGPDGPLSADTADALTHGPATVAARRVVPHRCSRSDAQPRAPAAGLRDRPDRGGRSRGQVQDVLRATALQRTSEHPLAATCPRTSRKPRPGRHCSCRLGSTGRRGGAHPVGNDGGRPPVETSGYRFGGAIRSARQGLKGFCRTPGA